MKQSPIPPVDSGPAKVGRTWGGRIYLALLLSLAAGVVILYLWKDFAVSRVRATAAAEIAQIQQEAERARSDLAARNKEALTAQAGEILMLSALPLSWVARMELLQKNYREIGIYFRQLVQQPKVKRALLVLPDGTIKVASNQSLEGKPVAEVLPGVSLEPQEPRAHTLEGELLVIVPVMGLNSRLGVVVVGYAVGAP